MALSRKEMAPICTKAAQILERDGFCTGVYGSNYGSKCALGALHYAHTGNVDDQGQMTRHEINALFRVVRPRSKFKTIADYNDADRRRKHDIVELLQDMAVAAAYT